MLESSPTRYAMLSHDPEKKDSKLPVVYDGYEFNQMVRKLPDPTIEVDDKDDPVKPYARR